MYKHCFEAKFNKGIRNSCGHWYLTVSVRAANCSMNVVLCNFCQSLSIVESDICCIVLHGTSMCLIRALIFPPGFSTNCACIA